MFSCWTNTLTQPSPFSLSTQAAGGLFFVIRSKKHLTFKFFWCINLDYRDYFRLFQKRHYEISLSSSFMKTNESSTLFPSSHTHRLSLWIHGNLKGYLLECACDCVRMCVCVRKKLHVVTSGFNKSNFG